MADTSNPQEMASKTPVPTADQAGTEAAVEESKTPVTTADQAGTEAAVEDQSRMCCAVGDLSCVVPVVAAQKGLPDQREEERDASKAPAVSRGDHS